jgi:hypothetical protein
LPVVKNVPLALCRDRMYGTAISTASSTFDYNPLLFSTRRFEIQLSPDTVLAASLSGLDTNQWRHVRHMPWLAFAPRSGMSAISS